MFLRVDKALSQVRFDGQLRGIEIGKKITPMTAIMYSPNKIIPLSVFLPRLRWRQMTKNRISKLIMSGMGKN